MAQTDLAELIQRLNLDISVSALERAFYHSSYVNEAAEPLESNERLEFLGDAVVELAVSEYLYSNFPYSEGELTKIKSVVVSEPILAVRTKVLNLNEYLFLGKGEEEAGGRSRRSILSDLFEAFVGAIFLECGYTTAAQFVLSQLKDEMAIVIEGKNFRDYKTLLQEIAQSQGLRPIYTMIDARGADHQKEFTVQVELDGEVCTGTGHRVKDAEQEAAKGLYQRIQST
ncbi:ribonuclease III [Candidatus Acetothermia bacterium]|nr:ribonuclease III [Candidatus Acetothermia bacterium]MBI3643910.1 ribonuclease III [Candidatus Acetothermia bacterium]